MKGKKPLLLGLLIVALFVVALMVPAAASGSSFNWVEGYNITRNSELQGRIDISAGVSSEGTLAGYVKVNTIRSDIFPIGERESTEFTDQEPWLSFFGPLAGHDFHKADDPYDWPAELTYPGLVAEPLLAETYYQANIADFVVYLPNPWFPSIPPLNFLGPYWPHRMVVIDFPGPWNKVLFQNYGWNITDPADPDSAWYWQPMADHPGANPYYGTGDPVPVRNGSFSVYVAD